MQKYSDNADRTAPFPLIPFLLGAIFFLWLLPWSAYGFDWRYEGRARAESSVLFDPPSGFSHLDSAVEWRSGLVGNIFEEGETLIDYEVVGDLLYTGGIREQSRLAEEYDAELFRGWVRLEQGNFKIRAGRQQILFGAGSLFRPLGFFDTRIISGIIPLTRGVDGVRSTYFVSDTSLIQGWAVPADKSDRFIVGLRGETQWGPLEVGMVAQYHPQTDLDFLPGFNQEMVQLGYHLKGEKEVGFWNESRLDIQIDRPGNPIRFDTVAGVDYTFNVGQGLHVLLEYFLSVQEKGFALLDLKGDRLIQNLGLQLDQPVGIDIVWRLFVFYDLGDQSFQVVPQVEYNIFDQWYLYLQTQIGGSIDGNNTTGRLFRQAPFFTGTESRVGLSLVVFF